MASTKTRLSWFPWNPSRFHAETSTWPLVAKAVYRELIDKSWLAGSVPPGPQRLRAMVEASPKEWRIAWPLVEPLWPISPDGYRRNEWVEEVRANAVKLAAKRAETGKRGAEKRWTDHGNSHADRMANAIPSNGNSYPAKDGKGNA